MGINEKRAGYNLKIAVIEQQMDTVFHTKRQMQNLFDALEGDLIRASHKLQHLNYELMKGGNQEVQGLQEEQIEQQRKLTQLFQQNSHEFNRQCIQTTERLNKERLRLQKERNELLWD